MLIFIQEDFPELFAIEIGILHQQAHPLFFSAILLHHKIYRRIILKRMEQQLYHYFFFARHFDAKIQPAIICTAFLTLKMITTARMAVSLYMFFRLMGCITASSDV